MRARPALSVALAGLLAASLAACSESAQPDAAVVGTSGLAPENNGGDTGPGRTKRDTAKVTRPKGKAPKEKLKHGDEHEAPGGDGSDGAAPGGPHDRGPHDRGTDGRPRAAKPHVSGPLRASVSDPTGDVRAAPAGAPPYADLTGAALTRGNVFEVRVSFAGAVPQRQSDDRVVQVATFYDLDGDGATDYEVWASLADDGWGTSYRTPDGARYGDDSGATARSDGNDLVLTFPLAHLERAESLAWGVGAQWGTFEQVASGTTSKDNAPDGGWARLPG